MFSVDASMMWPVPQFMGAEVLRYVLADKQGKYYDPDSRSHACPSTIESPWKTRESADIARRAMAYPADYDVVAVSVTYKVIGADPVPAVADGGMFG